MRIDKMQTTYSVDKQQSYFRNFKMQIKKTYKNQKVKESGGQKCPPLVIYDHLVLISLLYL
jgi:hypothetical protein